MRCTYDGGRCRNKWRGRNPIWETRDSIEAIAAGWRLYRHDGVGDAALKDGEALCPKHAKESRVPGPYSGT